MHTLSGLTFAWLGLLLLGHGAREPVLVGFSPDGCLARRPALELSYLLAFGPLPLDTCPGVPPSRARACHLGKEAKRDMVNSPCQGAIVHGSRNTEMTMKGRLGEQPTYQ